MQIELMGCTSAGKSTLARDLLRVCREQGLDILPGEDFVLKQYRLNWINKPRLRKLLVNLAALVASLITWQNNHEFYRFAGQLLFQLPIPRLERLHLLRNILKRFGTYEIIRLHQIGQQVILVDEGVLQTAHNLFVHVAAEVQTDQLATFVELIPLPDVIVYLKQPEGLLIYRTRRRGHKRIPGGLHSQVVHFVKQAVATFDELEQHPLIKSRLLVFDGSWKGHMAAPDPNDHIMDLASKIIRIGFDDKPTPQPAEIIYVE